MNIHQQKVFGFQPTLFERLLTDNTEHHDIYRWNIQELKDSVARDLEELLNTRSIHLDAIDEYPHAKKAILNFGILDFVGLSTANPLHRDQICRAIQATIADQETRLSHVQVFMHIDSDHVGSLLLTIKGVLIIRPIQEPVIFDAVLNPATQQYSIKTASL
jgi:type VI secretion system protein ImpF